MLSSIWRGACSPEVIKVIVDLESQYTSHHEIFNDIQKIQFNNQNNKRRVLMTSHGFFFFGPCRILPLSYILQHHEYLILHILCFHKTIKLKFETNKRTHYYMNILGIGQEWGYMHPWTGGGVTHHVLLDPSKHLINIHIVPHQHRWSPDYPDYIFDCTDTSPIFYLCGYPFRSILSHYWCLGALTSTPPHVSPLGLTNDVVALIFAQAPKVRTVH